MKLIIFLILMLNALADTNYFSNAQIGNVTNLDPKLILQLNSTTKASLFAPRMTTVQRNAIAQPIIGGSVVFDTDLNNYFAWDTLNLTWKAIGGGAASLSNWTANTAYKIGSSVVVPGENNDVFRALTDHTSAATFNADRLAGAWEKISPTYFKIFTPATQFFTGDIIKTIDDQLFVARVNFIAAADPVTDVALNNMQFRSPNDFTTSPLRGGAVTYAAPNFSITAGTGVIVTNAGTPFSQITTVPWTATTITTPLPNPTGYNTIQVNNAGIVSAISGINPALASKQNITLAIVFGPTNDIIPIGKAAVDHGNDIRTLSMMLGIVKSGIIFNGNAGAQTFISTSGNIFLDGIGKGTETPSLKACPPQAVTSFLLYDRDTALGVNTIIPNNQYDVAGTETAVPGTNWTYHKIFLAPNCQIFLQYGQDVAPSKNEITALEEANRDNYVVNPQLEGIVKFIGVVYFQNNNADFSSLVTTYWRNSGLFGIGSAGSGSSITATGDILGPDSAIDSHPLLFDGTTGKLAKDASGATFDPNGGLTLDGGTAGLLVTKPTGSANLQTTGLTFTNTASAFSLALLPSPAPAGNLTLTFPPNAPSANQILQSDSFGQLSWVPNGSLTNWVASHAYIAGETVVSPTDSNDVFRALSAHTSTASFTADRLAGNWEMISPSHFIPFTPAKQYFAEDLIRISDGAIYKATGNFIANANPAVDIAAGRMEFMSPSDYTTSTSSGGVVTFGANYAITAGTGFIVTNGGTPFSTIQNVTWNATNIAEPLPNPTGYNTISVSGAGVVSASTGLDTPASAKASIVLATVFAPSRTIILRNGAATDHGNTNRSLSLILGLLKDKIEFTGNANLTFQTKAGSIYWDGIAPGTEQPNVRDCPVQTATAFIRYDQDSSYPVNTLLDTLNWDNGGTLAGIPANNWGYHKIFLAPNCQVYIQYGQQFAASEAAITAAEEAGRNSYITNPALASGMKFVGLVFFQQNRTDVSESALVTWVNSGLFGMGVAGSGSTVTTNGDVFGPASAADRAIAVFDGGSGKTLVDTVPTIDTVGSISGVQNLTVNGLNTNAHAAATAAFTLHAGRNTADGLSANQTNADMAFEFGGTSGYKHYISTTHTGTANSTGNAMKFWMNNGLQFGSTEPGTGNALALTLTPVGVGVLTAAPFQELDVLGDIVTSFHGNASQHNAAELGNRRIGHISGTNAEFAGMQVNVKATESDGTTARANTADIAFYTWGQSIAASNEQMRITERGRVGINTTNPISLLSVNGDLTVGGAGSTANVGVGNLKLVGPVTNAAGPHMTFNDDTDIYPQRHFLNWGHNSIHDCFDCYFDGTNWRNSTTSSSFRWTKDAVYLQLSAVEVPTVGGTEAASPIAYFHENGTMLLRKWQTTGGDASYPYQGGTIDFYTSRGRVAEIRGVSSSGGNLDGSSEMFNNNGGWGWQRAWQVYTSSPTGTYFNGPISASNVTNRSSAILKKNIQPIPPEDIENFLKLNPIKYQNRDAPYAGRKIGEPLSEAEVDDTWRYGFVIEALEEQMPRMVEGKGKMTQTIMEYDESGVATATDAPVAAYSIPSMLALTVEALHRLNEKVDALSPAEPSTPTEPIDTSMFVVGPASSIDNNIPRFDGTTGKKVQGSGIKIDDLNNFTGINNITLSASITAGGSIVAGGSGQFGGTVSALDFIVNGAAMSATIAKQNKTIADLLKRIQALEKK